LKAGLLPKFAGTPPGEIGKLVKEFGRAFVFEGEEERKGVVEVTFTGDVHGDYLIKRTEVEGGEDSKTRSNKNWKNYKQVFNPYVRARGERSEGHRSGFTVIIPPSKSLPQQVPPPFLLPL